MLSEDKRIHTKQELREWLALEHSRYPLTARHLLPYLFQWSEGAVLHRHTTLLRTTEYHLNNGHRLRAAWYNARLIRLQTRYCMHVPLNCLGKGVQIAHLYPLQMNWGMSVGENCRILPGVMILGDDTAENRAPTIGDHVTLCAGCKIFGDVQLADHITVGAGAVVNRSFTEPGITIAGVPARKVGGPVSQRGDE